MALRRCSLKAVARLLGLEVTIAFSIGQAEPASSALYPSPGPAQDNSQLADVPPSTLAVIASCARPASVQPSLPPAVLECLCQPTPTCGLTTHASPAHGSVLQVIQESHVGPSTRLAIIGAVSIKGRSMIVPQQPRGSPATTGHAVSSTILVDPRLLTGIKVCPSASHQACFEILHVG